MFTCSVGDEVASRADQQKARNDRQALVAKYRKLQTGSKDSLYSATGYVLS
jgi:hypothetical protein